MKDISITLVNESCFSFLKELESNSIDLALIDPPYEVSRETNFKSGKAKGKDTDRFRISMDFGDWDSDFTGLDEVIKELYRVLRKGGTLICFYDIWKISILRRYFDDAKFRQIRFIEWVKTNPVPINSKINYLTNAREIAVVAVKEGKATFHSEYDNGIYRYPICHDRERFHPTQKPLALIEELVIKHSNEGDMVLDCFAGSATTAVAAYNQSRNFIGCELSKEYYKGSYLGKKYKIKRPQKGGKVFAVRLDGPNANSVKKHRGIRQDIRAEISKQRCVVLDIGSSIEVDHKNGKYDELSNIELENQKIDDFQPLSKAANDAKRQHCKDCIKTARRLGYKEGWVVGDENTSPCIGCYWYDPKRFNQLISKDYKKEK